MKVTNKFLLTIFLVILMPVLSKAHPGHEHNGDFWETFTHFWYTYYIYIIMSMVFALSIFRYLYLLQTQKKTKSW
jgi:hypothetical protein